MLFPWAYTANMPVNELESFQMTTVSQVVRFATAFLAILTLLWMKNVWAEHGEVSKRISRIKHMGARKVLKRAEPWWMTRTITARVAFISPKEITLFFKGLCIFPFSCCNPPVKPRPPCLPGGRLFLIWAFWPQPTHATRQSDRQSCFDHFSNTIDRAAAGGFQSPVFWIPAPHFHSHYNHERVSVAQLVHNAVVLLVCTVRVLHNNRDKAEHKIAMYGFLLSPLTWRNWSHDQRSTNNTNRKMSHLPDCLSLKHTGLLHSCYFFHTHVNNVIAYEETRDHMSLTHLFLSVQSWLVKQWK